MTTETWIEIGGTGGAYQVSNLGKVKSVERRVTQIDRGVECTRLLKERFLRPNKKPTGYLNITIQLDKKSKTLQLHRLVAKAFVPNSENKPCVNHKDGNKENNNSDNLEWCTYQENIDHSWRKGLVSREKILRGEKHPLAKLTNEDVLAIRKEHSKTNCFHWVLANKYGIERKSVSDILSRKRWSHI